MKYAKWIVAVFILIASSSVLILSLKDQDNSKTVVSLQQVENALIPDPKQIQASKGDLPLEPTRPGNQNHFHASLRFSSDGGIIYPPRFVGRAVSGNLAIHTHDQSGVIHFHQPLDFREFHLSDIWRAWGLKVNQSSFAGLKPFCIYINGKPISGDPKIKNFDDIQVDFQKCKDQSDLEKFNWNAQNVYLEGAK